MKINTFKFFLMDAFRSLKRNSTVSLAAVATVTATLFILGVFALSAVNINLAVKDVESKVEAKVYLKENISDKDKKAVEEALKTTDGVVNVRYESKQQALENFKGQLGEQNKGLVEGLDKDNPMPESFVVSVKQPSMIKNVSSKVGTMTGVDKVNDGSEDVSKLVRITNAIRWIGIVLFVVLIGVSLFLIGNTIKLTVYSRRREIGIMKYIGATDWFIRWPFLMEGIIIGICGSVFATVILYYAYKAVFAWLNSSLILITLQNPSFVSTTMLGVFVLAGIMIGATGSIMSIRKFLKV